MFYFEMFRIVLNPSSVKKIQQHLLICVSLQHLLICACCRKLWPYVGFVLIFSA